MQITGKSNNFKGINVKHNFFKDPFLPSVISEWDKPDLKIRDVDRTVLYKQLCIL